MKVTQSCLTLCNPMDSTVHGILQARILEWVVFPFSRGFSQPTDQTQVSRIADGFFTSWATKEAQEYRSGLAYPFFSRSSWPRSLTWVSCIADGFFTSWATREAQEYRSGLAYPFSRGSSQPRSWTWVSCIVVDSLPTKLLRKLLLSVQRADPLKKILMLGKIKTKEEDGRGWDG